ncbi:hypothetical protein KAR91_40825 [Candidatus Pacearchaeota archaeon]|nr:hypothetical protein [Candidatus Pacearchaeota archaeon]
MKKRIDAIKDLPHILITLGISSNAALWEKEFLANPDEEILKKIELKDQIIQSKKEQNKYKGKRKAEYLKRGLTFDKFVEALIEDDMEVLTTFRNERQIVKKMYPKND